MNHIVDMEDIKKNFIYERLLGMSFSIDLKSITSPTYINERIWQCHNFIEEVERYSIELSQESSVIQQAVNNSQAEYDTAKETLLVSDDIKNLPSIKDREAKCNQLLKKELNQIRNYQNGLMAINNLLKATNLKIKNLNRANSDIKVQVRILETQLRINGGQGSDKVTRGLIEEMTRSSIGEDSFKEAVTEEIHQEIVDPSIALNVGDLLKGSDSSSNNLLGHVPFIDSSEDALKAVQALEKANVEIKEQVKADESGINNLLRDIDQALLEPIPDIEDEEEIEPEEDSWLSQIDSGTDVTEITEEEQPIIDIDKILTEQGGVSEEPPKPLNLDKNKIEPEAPKNPQLFQSKTVVTGIDLDDILDSIT